MITTVNVVKSITGYSGNDKDPEIEELIREKTLQIPRFCNNQWASENINLSAGTLTLSGTTVTNSVTPGGLDIFAENDTILIYGSERNSDYYRVTDITDPENIEVNRAFDTAEAEGPTLYLIRIDWPYSVRRIAARLISYDVFVRPSTPGMASERVGTYSIAYRELGGLAYPGELISPLALYRRPVKDKIGVF